MNCLNCNEPLKTFVPKCESSYPDYYRRQIIEKKQIYIGNVVDVCVNPKCFRSWKVDNSGGIKNWRPLEEAQATYDKKLEKDFEKLNKNRKSFAHDKSFKQKTTP